MEKQNFQHHYSSLQYHMSLQKSFYADLLLKEHFIIFLNVDNSCATYYIFFCENNVFVRVLKKVQKNSIKKNN